MVKVDYPRGTAARSRTRKISSGGDERRDWVAGYAQATQVHADLACRGKWW